MKKQKNQIVPLLPDTYLALIKNSIGTRLFRNAYAGINRTKKDILQNGELSCAFFVSGILIMLGLIKEIHATVVGAEKDLIVSGWKKIKLPKIGSILVWENMDFGRGGQHKHIGFYIGNNRAISNSMKTKCPMIHHWIFGTKNGKPVRKIESIYWHKKLNKK